ncbi:MAG: ethanolamine ammonia-lyase reactivating factor EutA [Alphaproteobacteria bacterium]
MNDKAGGGRFSNANRNIADEEEIVLISVGVDIGSSTSHLVFSRVTMERLGARYIVAKRETLHEAPITLTPYAKGEDIDADALGIFIEASFKSAGLARDEIDTGALILTGVAVRRRNARAIADLFAEEAGKFVAVSAGDGLEATMSAHGSGAVLRSARSDGLIINIDIGGGTTKIAHCRGGKVSQVTALDAGARLVVLDGDGCITRIEPTGQAHADDVGAEISVGAKPDSASLVAIADRMAERIIEAAGLAPLSAKTESMLLIPPLPVAEAVDALTFSGGVSEYVYGNQNAAFGDLGPDLARLVRARIEKIGAPIEQPVATIRATVVGASQYTVQLSGTTIYIDPPETVPLRNVPVIEPDLDLTGRELDPDAIAAAIGVALTRLDLRDKELPVALAFRWKGSASFQRLDQFGNGVHKGLRESLDHGQPLVLVSDGDIGGLVGIHLKEEMGLAAPVISVDGIELQEFDYIDIGELIPSSGAVPVVIKSLVFPASS